MVVFPHIICSFIVIFFTDSFLEPCSIPHKIASSFRYCQDLYSLGAEDKTPFYKPGWHPVDTTTYSPDILEQCPVPWRYITPDDSHTLPSWGKGNVYNGGGFIANLGYSEIEAISVIRVLQQNSWIDIRTRVVILEISTFSPYTNLLTILTSYFEIPPASHGEVFQRVQTMSLYSEDSAMHSFYLVCQLLFILMVVFYSIVECFAVLKQKRRYFSSLWNWISLLQLLISVAAVVLYILRSKSVTEAVREVRRNPFSTVSFQRSLLYLEAENVVLGFVIFLSTLKFVRLFRFNHHVIALAFTIRRATKWLMSFSVIFLLLFFIFALVGILLFGSDLESYSTFIRSLSSLFETLLGQSVPIYELSDVKGSIARIYVFSFLFVMTMIMINMFMVILNDAQVEASRTDENSTDLQMGDFIYNKLGSIFARTENRNGAELTPLSISKNGPQSKMYKFCNSTKTVNTNGETRNVASSYRKIIEEKKNEKGNCAEVPQLVQIFEESDENLVGAVNEGFEPDGEFPPVNGLKNATRSKNNAFPSKSEILDSTVSFSNDNSSSLLAKSIEQEEIAQTFPIDAENKDLYNGTETCTTSL